MGELLKMLPNLENIKLNLSDNNFGTKGVNFLIESIDRQLKLTCLNINLNKNNIYPEEIK